MKTKASVLACVVVLALGAAQGRADTDLSLDEQLARLPRLATLAWITAHPDDESAAMITFLARGLHCRVVVLALTRGEGGQNSEGPEIWDELARIRTKELRAAVAAYGAEVRFLGAADFGYSKSLAETAERWNADQMLRRLVWQIRSLRPLAVVAQWRGTPRDGSAHHQTAGLLAQQAFAAAGDIEAYPEHFEQGLLPWQARTLLVRTFNPEDEGAFKVPADQPSPVPGKTYEEVGWEGFQQHRSQGMHRLNLQNIGRFRRYYLRVAARVAYGPAAPTSVAELAPDLAALPDLFPSVPALEGWRERLAQVVELSQAARSHLAEDKPSEAALALVQGAGLLAGLRRGFLKKESTVEAAQAVAWVEDKERAFLRAAAALADVRLEAYSDRTPVTPGERVWAGLQVRADNPAVFHAAGFEFGGLRLVAPDGWGFDPLLAETADDSQRAEFVIAVPEKLDPEQVLQPLFRAQAVLTTGSLRVVLDAPVFGLAQTGQARAGLAERLDPRRLFGRHRDDIPIEEAQLEPLSLAPAVTLEVEPPLRLAASTPGETTHEWCLELTAHRPEVGKISAWLEVPLGWYSPVPRETELKAAGQRATLCLLLTLPGKIPPGRYELQAMAGRGIHTYERTRAAAFDGFYSRDFNYPPARARLEVLDLKVPPGLRIGYIGFNNDPVPALLAPLGISVDMLEANVLPLARLADYDAIVIATRAYDYRPDLADETPRLLEYVKAGGTLVVELQGRRWDPAKFAPYPASKPGNRNLRVTEEDAAVRVLAPAHPVFRFPNAIGEDDWRNWRHERGLYFWETWSEEYTPLLAMADQGAEPLQGALLYARHGEGVYIYNALSLFRQVRAGVPGGVRLYLNLLSQSRALEETAAVSCRWGGILGADERQ